MPTDPDTSAIPGRAHIVTDSPLPTPTHGVPNHHTLSFSILCERVIPVAPADCLDVILDAKACMFGPLLLQQQQRASLTGKIPNGTHFVTHVLLMRSLMASWRQGLPQLRETERGRVWYPGRVNLTISSLEPSSRLMFTWTFGPLPEARGGRRRCR